MWVVTDANIMEFVGRYVWPMFRISSLFMAMPIIGTKIVPSRVRIVLAVMISILVTPLLPPMPVIPLLSLQSLMVVLQQIVIGVSIGFFLQVLFQIFVLAGQFMAMKMGLGFASMNDPSNGVTVTVLSQFYLIITTLLFLSLNGHLVVIELIVGSFTTLPISQHGLSTSDFWDIAASGSWLFSKALLVAMPVLTALLVVNLAFGVMSRVAPQMNVFAVGFPITLLMGLILIYVSLNTVVPNFISFVDEGFSVVHSLLRIP
jgi:flagellar biosynthetic protein FliR